MLEINSLEQRELPDLNQGRFNHASIILNSYLFVLGGMSRYKDYPSAIECLSIAGFSAWSIILEGKETVKRINASVTAVSATKLLVCGGESKHASSDSGYVFDVKTHALHQILGQRNDFPF